MEAEEREKWGRPGLIHHVSDVRWTQGGRENDVRGRGPTTKKKRHWIIRSSALRSSGLKTLLWSKLLAFTSKKLAFGVYSLHIWISAPPLASTHVMDETRPSLFLIFALFRFRVIMLNANRRTKNGGGLATRLDLTWANSADNNIHCIAILIPWCHMHTTKLLVLKLLTSYWSSCERPHFIWRHIVHLINWSILILTLITHHNNQPTESLARWKMLPIFCSRGIAKPLNYCKSSNQVSPSNALDFHWSSFLASWSQLWLTGSDISGNNTEEIHV